MATEKNRIVLVGNEKGGVGKTTVAFNLAVMRVKQGRNVILVDTDKPVSYTHLTLPTIYSV